MGGCGGGERVHNPRSARSRALARHAHRVETETSDIGRSGDQRHHPANTHDVDVEQLYLEEVWEFGLQNLQDAIRVGLVELGHVAESVGIARPEIGRELLSDGKVEEEPAHCIAVGTTRCLIVSASQGVQAASGGKLTVSRLRSGYCLWSTFSKRILATSSKQERLTRSRAPCAPMVANEMISRLM